MNWLIEGWDEICSLLESKAIAFVMNVVGACSWADACSTSMSGVSGVPHFIPFSVFMCEALMPVGIKLLDFQHPQLCSPCSNLRRLISYWSSPLAPISPPSKEPSQQRVKKWGFSLEEALKDPAGQDLFLKFLESEFSSENLRWAEKIWTFFALLFNFNSYFSYSFFFFFLATEAQRLKSDHAALFFNSHCKIILKQSDKQYVVCNSSADRPAATNHQSFV